jgi:hypothetical protein
MLLANSGDDRAHGPAVRHLARRLLPLTVARVVSVGWLFTRHDEGRERRAPEKKLDGSRGGVYVVPLIVGERPEDFVCFEKGEVG